MTYRWSYAASSLARIGLWTSLQHGGEGREEDDVGNEVGAADFRAPLQLVPRRTCRGLT